MQEFGSAQSWVSAAVTNKFWVIDRAMFAMSPYLTDDESWKIVQELERMATSKLEGNFTGDDAINWLAQQLGAERYQAISMMWILDNQQAIQRLYKPEQLRDAWVHKITMTEATPEELEKNPKNYVKIQTTKDEYK